MIESFLEKGGHLLLHGAQSKRFPLAMGAGRQGHTEDVGVCVHAEFYHVFSRTLCVRLKQGGLLCVCQNLLFFFNGFPIKTTQRSWYSNQSDWQEGLPPSVSGSDPGARRGVPHLRGPAARSLCSQTKGLFPAALCDHLLRLNQHVLNAVCTL